MPSLIKADANRQKGIEGAKGLPPEATGRAIKEYMAVLDDEAFGAATDVVPKFEPILQRDGPEPMADRPSLLIPPTI